MNTKQRKYKNAAMVFLTIILLLSTSRVFSQEKAVLATIEITLKGNAEGGVLTLVEIPQRNCRYVSISTQSGESSESVAMRLANIINNSNPFEWGGGNFEVIVKDSSLTLLGQPGTYAFAGTERGLGIPEPPTSLSGMYDMENEQIILNWQNPTSGFDGIFIAKYGFPCPTYSMITGSEEKYVYQLKDKKINSTYFCIIGIRDGVPSSPAAIQLTVNAQEELFGIPFYNGVAPNWTTWSTGRNANEVGFEQVVRERYVHRADGGRYNPVRKPETKPFSQIIRTKSPKVIAGVRRKFLGLTAGHTYRLSARLNTLEMDSCKTEWSFALHAACNAPGGGDLTTMQLAGAAALPDGSSGPAAGRIASYSPTATTKGKWVEHSTDITLPAGVDTITVWVRHSGADTTGVGIDWVKLENLSQ
jgi:hypothetical protein